MNIGSSENGSVNPTQDTSSNPSVRAKTDPAWAYFSYKKEGKQNVYTCLCCNNVYKGGGINRMKQHLAGIVGNIASCKKVTHDVRHAMKMSLNEGSKKVSMEDIGEEEVGQGSSASQISVRNAKKKKASTMDEFIAPRTTPGSQPSLKSVLASKEAIHRVMMMGAEWAIVNCIPFNALGCPLFQRYVDGIASIGPGYKAPSPYVLKTTLLKDWKDECAMLIEEHRQKWKESGCTLMADGWTDVRNQNLINFLVYSPHGLVYVKSINATALVKTAETLFTLFREVIEWVGPASIVHVVTDNAANYVACGRLITERYKGIYWSPCTVHCLNLLLKDIAELNDVLELATKASKITVFAYNHSIFLSWLRKRKGWVEIVRPGATRFATTFITLHSIYKHKHDLQALVVDKHFLDHKLSKKVAGKTFSAIILDNRFWNECYKIVKIVTPLVKLLRIVDSDEKPSLPYVYEGMYRAKLAIKETFKRDKVSKYKKYTKLVKDRWDRHLKGDLHAAACLLNPAYMYAPNSIIKGKVITALVEVLEKIAEPRSQYFKLVSQFSLYREGKRLLVKSHVEEHLK